MDAASSRNMGKIDRGARFVLGLILLGFALFCPFAASLGPVVVWGSGVIGAVFLVTSVLGVCPLYRVIGIQT